MKRVVALLVMASLLSGCTPNNKIPDGYKLFFEDEFDGDKLSNDWSYEIGNGNLYAAVSVIYCPVGHDSEDVPLLRGVY